PGLHAEIVPARQAVTEIAATPVAYHDVPSGWIPKLEADAGAVAGLRDAVLSQLSSRPLCLAVTGSAAGRAPVAAALGVALAQGGLRVLLVEADFDKPELHLALGVTAP